MVRLALLAAGAVALLMLVAPEQSAAQEDACPIGLVWRDARPGDHQCVTAEIRAVCAADLARRTDPRCAPPQQPIRKAGEAKVKSNTQVRLPGNLYLADLVGDGIDDFIQISGTAGKGDHNRILVFRTDFPSTGLMHLYLDTDVVKVFAGNFMLPGESGYGPDQLCVTTASGSLDCYMSKNGKTLSLVWSQRSFILPDEEVIVGDFEGKKADAILLYRPSVGGFRVFTRALGEQASRGFAAMPTFSPGALANGKLVNVQLRVGRWIAGEEADGLIAYQPTDGQVTVFRSVVAGESRTFAATLTAGTHPTASGVETLSTGRLLDRETDSLVLRNNLTGAYRFFDLAQWGADLATVTGVVAGQLPVLRGAGQLVFARLSASGSVRDDTLFFEPAKHDFIATFAAHDASKAAETYWWGFTEGISTRDQGWPPVDHDTWLVLRCKFPDFPNLIDPIFATDTFIENWLGKSGLGGHADFLRLITYGRIDFHIELAPGWSMTAVSTTKFNGPPSRYPAISSCAKNYGHGITDASFRDGAYVGPKYRGIIALWNKQRDAGSAGGNLLNLDSGALYMSFSAHENLHGYGLAHGHSDVVTDFCQFMFGKDIEYCDIWDPMGGSQAFGTRISTYNEPQYNPGIAPDLLPSAGKHLAIEDGTELNGPHRLELGAIPADRIVTLVPRAGAPQTATVSLAALEKPEANGPLLIKILFCDVSGKPCDDPNHFYTVEFRQPVGWDLKFPESMVQIHEVLTEGRPALQSHVPPTSWWTMYVRSRPLPTGKPPDLIASFPEGEFFPGLSTTYAKSKTTISVQSFDLTASTAKISIVY
jgi:hypothetical protein